MLIDGQRPTIWQLLSAYGKAVGIAIGYSIGSAYITSRKRMTAAHQGLHLTSIGDSALRSAFLRYVVHVTARSTRAIFHQAPTLTGKRP